MASPLAATSMMGQVKQAHASWSKPRWFGSEASDPASISSRVPIKIYQYEICPFCNKVKAVLDYCKFSYTTVEVNPLSKKEINFTRELPSDHACSNYRKVPIALVGEDLIADSSLILNAIVEKLSEEKEEKIKLLCSSAKDPQVQEWVRWADQELAVLLFPNLTRTFSESFQAFSYVQQVPTFSLLDKLSNHVAGATAMWLAQGKLKSKYKISDERQALALALAKWADALDRKPFLGGSSPNLADLCVFGVLRAVDGSATQTVIEESPVSDWYGRMRESVGERGVARVAREAQ
uniref:GST N-terminal domain-containing protein n=1 Tax=Hanusia phi TaxID=3032 RepID=A0A7S0HU74_9CRYP